jgi:hypothetical protein
MTYLSVSEHWLTYVVVSLGILYILSLTVVIMRRAWKRALQVGFTKDQLRKIVKNSITCAFVPAVTVLIGFLLLAPLLGIPLSWWRLSIVGNTAYEIMAANIALSTTGAASADIRVTTGTDFILVMYVMAIGIMGGLVIAPLLSKRIHKGAFKLRENDRRWGALSNGAYMAAILIVFVVPILFKPSSALLTLVISAMLMLLFQQFTRRFKFTWLSGLAFTISTLIAMMLSILWNHLFV